MNRNFRLKCSLFANYIVNGAGLIILTQNLMELAHNWHTGIAEASYILSGIGIGRLVAYLIMGWLSDHWGRKPTLMIGMLAYLVFFLVTPVNSSMGLAYVLTILAGIGNSAMDSATYPLLEEINVNGTSSSVLIKAFISLGEFIIPLIIIWLHQEQMWFGFSFVLPVIILILNILNVLTLKIHPIKKSNDSDEANALRIHKLPKFTLTAALIVFGYTSMAAMIWFTQWITIFTEQIGFNKNISHFLLSLYSIGSISGVIIVALILRLVDAKRKIFLILSIVALLSIIGITISQSVIVTTIATLAFGISAAGGLMQIGLNTLLSIYPKNKGLFTGLFFIAGSLASFSVPLITGWLTKIPGMNIMAGDIIILFISLIVALIFFMVVPQSNSLEDARHDINQIDHKLIILLEQRFSDVEDVHKFKKINQLPVLNQSRESEVLKRVEKQTQRKELVPYMQNIIQNIMDNSKKYQQHLK